jgi:hypothetical protein
MSSAVLTSTDSGSTRFSISKATLQQLFGNSVRDFALSLGKKNFYTFGEVLEGASEQGIARFIGRNTTTGDDNSLVGVDAALDYPLFCVLTPT